MISAQTLPGFFVDYDFVKTLGVQIVEGRDFSRELRMDSAAFVLNEAAVKAFDWESPLGRSITYGRRQGPVIGVVQDFNFKSLHQRITPLIVHARPIFYQYVIVRVDASDFSSTVQFLEDTWSTFFPERPFECSFLDDDLDQLYRAEQRLSQVFAAFSFLAIFVACLGLFGLASFMAEQRTKEMGVRKVLGVLLSTLILLLSKDFTKLVAIAVILAWPVAYFVMNRWLQDFASRTEMNAAVFILAGAAALATGHIDRQFSGGESRSDESGGGVAA